MNISALSTEALRRELERRANSLEQLKTRREHLVRELADLDAEIAALSGAAPGATARKPARVLGSRPKNSLSLPDAIAAGVEPGQQISPTEAADLVRKNGYVTTAKSFRQIVAVALAKHPGFKRVDRGRYERTS